MRSQTDRLSRGAFHGNDGDIKLTVNGSIAASDAVLDAEASYARPSKKQLQVKMVVLSEIT